MSILGADYRGDLVPDVESGSRPDGPWIRLLYGGTHTYYQETGSTPTYQTPFHQAAYLTHVVTPTHVARFNGGGSASPPPMPYQGASAPTEPLTQVDLRRWTTSTWSLSQIASHSRQIRRVELDLDAHFSARGRWRSSPDNGEIYGAPDNRLRLTGIRFFDADDNEEPGYSFAYNSPNPTATQLNGNVSTNVAKYRGPQDDFGYYSTRPHGNYWSPSSSINGMPAASAWSLTAITYPGGVTEEIEYEDDLINLSGDLNGTIGLAFPYARAVGVLSNSWGTNTGDYYYFKCGYNVASCNTTDPLKGGGPYQGGTRVKAIERSGALIPTTRSEYAYDRAIPSAIPEGYWHRKAAATNANAAYRTSSRGAAEVYYYNVTREEVSTGARSTTHYTTAVSGPAGPQFGLSLEYRWDGAVNDPDQLNVVTGNETRLWGKPYHQFDEQPGDLPDSPYRSTTVETDRALIHREAATITPGVTYPGNGGSNTAPFTQNVYFGWGYAEDVVETVTTSTVGGASTAISDTVRYVRDYTSQNVPSGFVRREIRDNVNQDHPIATERTYAYDVAGYSDLFEAGILSPVVRQDVYEYRADDSGSSSAGGGVGNYSSSTSTDLSGETGPPSTRRPNGRSSRRASYFTTPRDSLCAADPTSAQCERGRSPRWATQPRPPSAADFGKRGSQAGGSGAQPPGGNPRSDQGEVGSLAEDCDPEEDPDCELGGGNPGGGDPPPPTYPDVPTVIDALYLRSQVTTWDAADPLVGSAFDFWKPKQTFAWLADDYSSTKPPFANWTGTNVESHWLLQSVNAHYDAHGQVTHIEDAVGTTAALTYGGPAESQVTQVALQGGSVPLSQSFTYDDQGRPISKTDENGKTWTFSYDAGGRLAETRDASGRVIESVAYRLDPPTGSPRFVETVAYRGGNLLQDGSFERGPGTWAWTHSGYTWSEDASAAIGRHRVRATSASASLKQTTAPVAAGQTLLLTLWTKYGNPGEIFLRGANATLLEGSSGVTSASVSGGIRIYHTANNSGSAWNQSWARVQANAAGTIEVEFSPTNSNEVRLDAVSLVPIPSGLTGTAALDAATPTVTLAFVDEIGLVRQQVESDGPYVAGSERIAATDYDVAGRPTKTYLVYPWNTGVSAHAVYDESAASHANSYYNGSTSVRPNAAGRAYAETEYFSGNSDEVFKVHSPGAVEGTGYVEHTYRPRRLQLDAGYYLSVREDDVTGEDGRRSSIFTDHTGQTVLERSYASIPGTGITVPSNIAVSQSASGTTSDTDTHTFTASINQFVRYTITLSVNGDRKATSQVQVKDITGGTQSTLIYEQVNNFQFYSGIPGESNSVTVDHGFPVFAGRTYRIELGALVGPIVDIGGTPEASLSGTIRFRNPDGSIPVQLDTRTDRDPLGLPVTIWAPNASVLPSGSVPEDWVTTYDYDTLGRVQSTETPDADAPTAVKYDKAGRVRFTQDAVRDAAGQVAFTQYDYLGRPTRSGIGGATFASLNPDATASFENTQANWISSMAYDAAPSTSSYPWSLFASAISAESSSLTNPKGRLVASAYRSGEGASRKWRVELFGYDAEGQVVTRIVLDEELPTERFTTAYNAAGQVETALVEVGGHSLMHFYQYNARGLLHRVYARADGSTAWPSLAEAEYVYDARGMPTTLRMGEQAGGGFAVDLPYTYDAKGRLRTIGNVASASNPFAETIHYDPGSEIGQIEYRSPVSGSVEPRWRQLLDYDDVGRLVDADHQEWDPTIAAYFPETTAREQITGYDANGNILGLKRWDNLGVLRDNLTYTYGTSNRLSSVDDALARTSLSWDVEDTQFTYDANGTMKTRRVHTAFGTITVEDVVAVDERNLPVRETVRSPIDNTSFTMRFRYNAEGQRILKEGAGGDLHYVRAGGRVVGVLNVASGDLLYWNLYGNDLIGRLAP